MIIRILIFSLLALCYTARLFAQEHDNGKRASAPLCGGVERWDEKVLTDYAASQVNYTPRTTTIDSLRKIPTSPNANATRMPGVEFQTYRVTCFIAMKKNESDEDYHLVLSDGSRTMVGEVPDPVCATASSSAHVNEFIAARNWVNLHIGPDLVGNINLPPVVITGVSFVDVPHGQTGSAPNQMEIHPILSIRFLSETGIDDPGNAPAFRVSVNPTAFSEFTRFHITSEKGILGRCRIDVYSSNGGKVRSAEVISTDKKEVSYTFERQGLPAGLYIYRVLNNGSILSEGKMIVN